MTGKLRATREERESEISQKDFGRRNAGAEERRARADRESVGKGQTESDMILDESDTTQIVHQCRGLSREARENRAS